MRRLGLVALAFALSGCPDNTPPVGITSLTITAKPVAIKADGMSTSKISVAGNGANVTLTVDKGTFVESGSASTVINGGSGSATLVSCDSSANASCLGIATISGTDGKLTGSATVKFVAGEICDNGLDDDGNGLIDCADPACDMMTCSFQNVKDSGECKTGACVCKSTMEICDNGVDDNCDGKIDCDDPQCAGIKCDAAGHACVMNMCKCPGASSEAGACNDGIDNDCDNLIDCMDPDCQPTGTAPGGLCDMMGHHCDSSGTCVTMPMLGNITLFSVDHMVLGVRSSGYQETANLVFQVTDTNGLNYPAGLTVTFTHNALGNGTVAGNWQASYIGTTPTNCANTTPFTCTVTGTTDANGHVQVVLHSGNLAGPVSVTATATVAGQTKSFTDNNLAIVGAKASGLNISMTCGNNNVGGITFQDCSNSREGGENISCHVALGDRFHNVLGVSQVVTFDSEAGGVGQPVNSDNTGNATDGITVLGFRLPTDVLPLPPSPLTTPTAFPGESYIIHNDDTCAIKIHNPRDGLVTVVARVNGEEGFVDGSNGCPANGAYDAPGSVAGCSGEFFYDQGEPFVDANDNGMRDANEPYFDGSPANGQYDPPNGTWDANTVIWAETRIDYSGLTAVINQPLRQDTQLFGQAWSVLTTGSPALPVIGPPKRKGTALAWDSVRNVSVLFGGAGASDLSDTWELDSATLTWTQLTPSKAPLARHSPTMIYDTVHGYTLLFGGATGSTVFNDTWTWDGSNWAQPTVGAAPPARNNAAAAIDQLNNVVLFGGDLISSASSHNVTGDMWSWSGATWTPICNTAPCNTTMPSARFGHAMAYDAKRSVVVLFGGQDQSGNALNDTWQWDGTAWTPVCTGSPCNIVVPPVRALHGLVYDSQRGAVVLFGGANLNGGGQRGDSWTFDGTSWVKLTANGPDARSGFGMVFDSVRKLSVLVGGNGFSQLASRFFSSLPNDTLPPSGVTSFVATSATTAGGPATAANVPFLFVDGNLNRPLAATTYAIGPLAGGVTAAITVAPDTADRVGMAVTQQFCPRHPFGVMAMLAMGTQPDRVKVSGLSKLSSASTTGDLGSYLSLDGAAGAGNNGTFVIVSVDVANNIVEILNPLHGTLPDTAQQWSIKPPVLQGCSNMCTSAPCYLETSVNNFGYGVSGIATVTCGMSPGAGAMDVVATTLANPTDITVGGTCQ